MIAIWFLFGGLWVPIVFGIMILMCIFESRDEYVWWTTFTIGLPIAFMILFTDAIAGPALVEPIHFWIFAGAYFPIGIGWSILKYYFRIAKQKDFAKKRYLDFSVKERAGLKRLHGSINTDSDNDTMTESEYVRVNMERPDKIKGKIIYWIVYWPFSFISTLLSDFMIEIGRWIYGKISNIYERIFEKVAG